MVDETGETLDDTGDELLDGSTVEAEAELLDGTVEAEAEVTTEPVTGNRHDHHDDHHDGQDADLTAAAWRCAVWL